MKKVISLVTVLLALCMALALSGCGDNPEGPAAEPSATVDLSAVRDEILSSASISDALNVETPGLEGLYGIPTDEVVSSASFSAASNGAFPQEVVMVQAADEAAVADIAAKLENRLSEIAEQASSYDPASQALAEECSVVQKGLYVGLFFSADHADMAAIFTAAVQ